LPFGFLLVLIIAVLEEIAKGNAFGDQGALFEKTAPWTLAKTFY
jgi:hypothetical protein